MNSSLLHNWQAGSTWYSETLSGGSVGGRPIAITDPNDNLLHVFARSSSNQLQHWYYYNGWNYEFFGDEVTGDPTATVVGPQLHVIARYAFAPDPI